MSSQVLCQGTKQVHAAIAEYIHAALVLQVEGALVQFFISTNQVYEAASQQRRSWGLRKRCSILDSLLQEVE